MSGDRVDQADPASAATSQRSVDQLILVLGAALLVVIVSVAVISIDKGTVEPVKELAQMLIAALAGALTTDAVRRWQRADEQLRWPADTDPTQPDLPADLFAPDPAGDGDAAAGAVPPAVAGWYPDPDGDGVLLLRWWDGSAWTDDRHHPDTGPPPATPGGPPP